MRSGASASGFPRRPALPSANREIEAKLRVVAPDPERVLREIGALRELAGYPLRDRGERLLRDVYFDTPEGELRGRRAGLRLRSDGRPGPPTLTLKLASEPGPPGLQVRPELERSFGPDAPAWLCAELAQRGVELPAPGGSDPARPPQQQLGGLGLRVIQERETRRQRLDALGPESALAEIALDRVRYAFPGLDARHCEVEVEAARHPEALRAVEALAHALRWGFALEPFGCDKLVLGLAFAALHAAGELAGSLDPAGVPNAGAYRWVRAWLERQAGGART